MTVAFYISILIVAMFSMARTGKCLRIGMMVSPQNEPLFRKNIMQGYDMAVNDSINDTITEPFEITYKVSRSCDGITGSSNALDLILNKSIHALFGSFCSQNCIASAQIANYWNIPYFPLDCFDSTLDNSLVYSTVIRIFGSLSGFGSAFQAFFKRNQWSLTSILTESNSEFCKNGVNAIRENFRQNSIKVGELYEIPSGMMEDELNMLMTKIRESARIIILCHTNYDFIRKLLYLAQDYGMTDPDQYAWITYYNIYGQFSFKMLFYPWVSGIKTDKSEETRKKAFQAVKIITYANFTTLPEPSPTDNSSAISEGRDRSLLMIFLADAANLFVRLRSKAFMLGLDYNKGDVLMNQSRHIVFQGMTQTVKFNSDADREMTYKVWTLTPGSQSFVEYLKINLTGKNYTAFLIGEEWWGNKPQPPPDQPKCGFDNKFCISDSDDRALTIGLSVSVLFAVIAISLAILIRAKINEQKIQSMAWKVKYGDLQFLRSSKSVRSVSKSSDMADADHCKVAMKSFRELQEEGSGEMLAYYKNEVVMVHYSSKRDINLTRKDLIELVKMKELQHDNLAKFIGACTETDRICFLMQFCTRGALQDVLADGQAALDWSFKISFVNDVAKGMGYLHRSFLVYHGRLTSNVCMVDNRWVIKISGFGFQAFQQEQRLEKQDDSFYRNLLWTAPEHLRSYGGSQKGDVYSFAIILYEILYRAFPYQTSSCDYKQIIENVLQPRSELFRPHLPELQDVDANSAILVIVKQCWAEEPSGRPSFEAVERAVRRLHSEKTDNIVDSMLKKLEKYANNLENIVEQRTEELIEEKRKTDILLHSMLPPFVAEELKAGRKVEPRMYDMATVYFSDIVGFTTLSSQSTPLEIVNLLNDLYGAFDDTIARHNVYKVETIGDAYMVVSGLPQVTDRHVVEICNMALDLLSIVQTFRIRHRPDMMLMLRIGIHSGPCAAGVVGHTMPRYCLFGDTVNTASRMESTGEALKIHLSGAAKEELTKFPGYVIELRGPTELKGKGTMVTYWLTKKDAAS